MRRQPWSDRISAAAIAACFHVLAILFLGLVSPTLHIPPRQPELETEEPVVEVELTRIPPPTPRLVQRQARIETEAPAPTPQVLSRPPSPSAPDSTAVIQPAPQPEAPPRPKPTPAPPVPTVEAKAQPLEPPKPADPPKAPEKDKEKEKEKEKEREREREKERLQTQLAAAPKAETPAPTPPPPARPTASAAAPFVPAPGFRLPPGYGRTAETESGGGLRSVLRSTVGCAHENYVALTPAERERCAKAFVRDASRGVRVDPLPSDKREGYDVEAASNARRRAAKDGGTASPVVACDGPGSNLGGGCLPPEAHTSTRRATPPPQ